MSKVLDPYLCDYIRRTYTSVQWWKRQEHIFFIFPEHTLRVMAVCSSITGMALAPLHLYSYYLGQYLSLDVIFYVLCSSPFFCHPTPIPVCVHTHTRVFTNQLYRICFYSISTLRRIVLLQVKRDPFGPCGLLCVTYLVTNTLCIGHVLVSSPHSGYVVLLPFLIIPHQLTR